MNSLPPSLWFPLRGERGNWKYNTFCAVKDSTMLRWHSGTQKRGGRTKQRVQINNEARLFWKSIVKTKHQSLTSLAFIRLVPGADRAFRHICIRCIYYYSILKTMQQKATATLPICRHTLIQEGTKWYWNRKPCAIKP